MTIPSIYNLERTVTELVTSGAADIPAELHPLLSSLGVAAELEGQNGWMAVALPFAQSALPVESASMLLRRVCLRDAKYRLLLDLSIAQIVQNIGRGERWTRLEELLIGPLNRMGSRLHQLMRWTSQSHSVAPHKLQDSHWELMKSTLMGDCMDGYRAWHQLLWGETRNGIDLFGALVTLYAPLCATPIHVRPALQEGMTEACTSLLIALTEAAEGEQGIILESNERPQIDAMLRFGIPVAVRPHDHGHDLCHLCGRVEVVFDNGMVPAEAGRHAVPGGLPQVAKLSTVVPAAAFAPGLSECMPWCCSVTVCSTTDIPARWPEAPPELPSVYCSIPTRDCLLQVGVSEKASPLVAPGLLKLAGHPVFGLLLQVLLMEALDRELGDATLILTPPLDRHVEDIHEATSVLYRPSHRDDTPATPGFLRLGSLDDVLTQLGGEVGLRQIRLPFEAQGQLWSYAFSMMADAGLTHGTTDRWSIHPDLLDRLHSGALMRQVIRDRKGLREQLHEILTSMWRNASEEQRV